MRSTAIRRWPGWLLGMVLALTGGSVLFAFDPARYSFYPRCFFHEATGLLCPGCGSLRAVHQLLHGHVGAALHLNALLVLGLAFLGWVASRLAWRKFTGQTATILFSPAWLWAALILSVLFGVLRNLPFARAAWLAP